MRFALVTQSVRSIDSMLNRVEKSTQQSMRLMKGPSDTDKTFESTSRRVTSALLSSGVLQDSDLIEIARHRSKEHLMVVARRDAINV